MPWRVLGRFADRFRNNAVSADSDDADDGNEADDGDDSRFVPSRLDASVLFAHGMGKSGAEREIANVEEKERLLEEQYRDR